jgi:Protein of unknown function (DUF2851)
MTEQLLQFIWQFSYFNKGELQTVAGERIELIHAGQHNTNQGPDFTNAKIKIGTTTWAGSVELHIRSSDWEKHRHTGDRNYDNVILHVVWEDDAPAGTLPVLELKDRISGLLLQRYEDLMQSQSFIACEKMLHTVPALTWKSWKDRLLAERLTRKSGLVMQYFEQSGSHWEEACWWLLARNFGIKINADAFEQVARSLPLNLLAKARHQIHQLESLLMGQAGLLNRDFEEDYPQLLQKEYAFQRRKYKLNPTPGILYFLRMRPVNFPTIRLAQLAMLIHGSTHLFAKVKDSESLAAVKTWLNVTANDYWHYHYRFDEPAAYRPKHLGESMITNIVINTLCPLLFAYGCYQGEPAYKNKALQWLEESAPENNAITRGFSQLGVVAGNAFDTQALLELKNGYCNHKRCLGCAAGNNLMKNC